REGSLDPDAKRLLADGEGLADARSLALDDGSLEDLRTAAVALDDLEMDLHAVARLEVRYALELRALEAFDDTAHGKKGRDCRQGSPRPAMVAKGRLRPGRRLSAVGGAHPLPA